METQALNDTLEQLHIIAIYRAFHLKTADYTVFSNAHGTFSRIDHMLGHKVSLAKFKKIEIISSIFSDHIAMILKVSYKWKKTIKNTNTLKINNILLNNQWITEETKEKIKT